MREYESGVRVWGFGVRVRGEGLGGSGLVLRVEYVTPPPSPGMIIAMYLGGVG